jgi:hypothetical protein
VVNKKVSLQSVTAKKEQALSVGLFFHCVTCWRQHRCLDSHLPRDINQSDCQITGNCGNIKYFHALIALEFISISFYSPRGEYSSSAILL